MRRTTAKMTVAALGVLAAVFGGSCHDAPNDCTGLRKKYETVIAAMCDANAAGPSRYCATCVPQGLFSYVVESPGVCRCAPLFFTGGTCAGNEDGEQLLRAITAADRECATFESDGGVGDDGGGSDGPGSDTDGMTGND
jgi:hypothetical protein